MAQWISLVLALRLASWRSLCGSVGMGTVLQAGGRLNPVTRSFLHSRSPELAVRAHPVPSLTVTVLNPSSREVKIRIAFHIMKWAPNGTTVWCAHFIVPSAKGSRALLGNDVIAQNTFGYPFFVWYFEAKCWILRGPVGNVTWVLLQGGRSWDFRLRRAVGQAAHTGNIPTSNVLHFIVHRQWIMLIQEKCM